MKIAILLGTSALLFGTLMADNRFSAEVEYLLFQAHQDGLFRATDIYFPPQVNDTTEAIAEDKYIEDNRWNSGVRASFTWEPECRPWKITAQYTYLARTIPSGALERSFTGNVFNENNRVILTDYMTNQIAGPFVYTNQASWKFSFNQIDLVIEQPFGIGGDSYLTPYFGLRGLCLDQHVQMSAHNTAPNANVEFFSVTHQMHIDPKLCGVGLVGGLEGRFSLGYGFDLWGKFGGGLIWGRFQTNQSDVVAMADGSSTFSSETDTHNFWGTSLNANLGLGVEWSCALNDESQWIVVTFGWENHLYMKANNAQNFFLEDVSIDPLKTITLDRNVQRGDFSLQGFSLGASYFF